MVRDTSYGPHTDEVLQIIDSIKILSNEQIRELAEHDNAAAQLVWGYWYSALVRFMHLEHPSWDQDDAVAAVVASDQWIKRTAWYDRESPPLSVLVRAEITVRYAIWAVIAQAAISAADFAECTHAWRSYVGPFKSDRKV